MKKKAVERIKTTLIVMLTISVFLLGWQTTLFNEFVYSLPVLGNVAKLVSGASAPGTTEPDRVLIYEAARPLAIVITNSNGERFGVRNNTLLRNNVYNSVSGILGEALGSASEPQEISEGEWRAALSGQGIYFEYFSPVKLSVLDSWLGAELPGTMRDLLLRRVFIAFGEDKSRVYYQDIGSGLFYLADTASSAGKAQELEIYNANGAMFAFETGLAVAENAPYLIVMQGNDYPDVRAAASGSADEIMDLTLDVLGYRNETYAARYDNDGFFVRTATQFVIEADAIGHVSYRRAGLLDPVDEGQLLRESELIEQARAVVSATLGGTCGEAEVFFRSLEYESGGSVSVYFDYYIAGGRILLPDNAYAARITLSGGEVSKAELRFRSYSLYGEHSGLLPVKQALASAGGEFVLSYSDSGVERIQPRWILYE